MTSEEQANRRFAERANGEAASASEEPEVRVDGGRNPEDSFSLTSDDSPSLAAEFPGGSEREDADESVPADEDGEVEPVELLVQLAKEGEIEPWDIDIVEVTDAFLERLDEADLRTSGRALFYASVLLRMKSDALLERPTEDDAEPDLEPWEEGFEPEDGGFDPVAGLESEMERRLERKPQRGSPETLDELVRDLREAERGSWWKESRTYDTDGSPRGFQRGVQELDYRSGDDFRMEDEPTEDEALGTAHQEDIEETIADVREALDAQYGKGRDEVLFEEVADTGGSRVQTFLALLFLAHRGSVALEQDELFGDLWIRDVA